MSERLRQIIVGLLGLTLFGALTTVGVQYAFGYYDEGQLVGHIPIAVAMLAETATKVPDLTGEAFPRELMLRIQHMILSHHGELNYGSPKVPMTPEAMLLHLIDAMDTRMHMVLRELKDDRNNPTAWTPYNHNLGRRIYKGGALGDLYGESGGGYD